MVQIDLGEVTGIAPKAVVRPPHRRRGRWMVASVVAAIALLLPTASTVSPPPLLLLRFQSDRSNVSAYAASRGYVVHGDALYLARPDRDEVHVARYPLDGSNRPRWDTALGLSGVDVELWWAEPVLVVRTGMESSAGHPVGTPTLTAIDAASGRRLWSRPGAWVQPDGHGHAVVGRDVGPAGESELVALDVRSGSPLWTDRPMGNAVLESTPDGLLRWPVLVATINDAGTVALRDPVAHRTIASRNLGLEHAAVQHLGSVVVVLGLRTDFGLDPQTLETRWEVNDPVSMLVWCDGAWCGSDGHLLVVDARTGEARQALAPDRELAGAQAKDHDMTLVGGWTVVSVRGRPSLLRVVDPKSGRSVLQMDGWSMLDFQEIEVTLGDAYVVVRDGVQERRWVGVVPLDRPRLVPLGQLNSDETGQCSAQGRYLSCWGVDGVLRLWRYNLS